METNLAIALGLLGILVISAHVQAQDQTGFISLDCGLVPGDETYTEKTTNLTFKSDARFIQTGESKSIKPEYQAQFQQQMWSLRSFPDGVRNCYNLNVTEGTKYLITASFLYGNYDDQNVLPSFDLYLGPNKWTSVQIEGAINNTSAEVIYDTKSSQLQICLVKTSTTTPFINYLELRPLNNRSYVAQTGALVKVFRLFLTSNEWGIRFEEDVHDRYWAPYMEHEWKEISTTLDVGTNNGYDVPQDVMRTAATPRNASELFAITWSLDNPNDNMYVYMHFAEIELLKSNETREFNITLNGEHWHGPFIPDNFSVVTVYNDKAGGCQDGDCNFSFIRTERSTHPPLLNALEVYTALTLPTLETDKNDVKAIKNIKATYDQSIPSWQGDPCSPREYRWDGLNCSSKDSESPRITGLILSSRKLKGEITLFIQDLTELEILDMSNNNLTGEFPEFLAKMKSLSFINLSGNNLSGSVPEAILRRINDGSLDLNVEGNEYLCGIDSCKPEKQSPLTKILVGVGVSVAVVIIALAVFLIFRTKRKKQERTKETVPQSTVSMPGAKNNPKNSSTPSIVTTDRRFTYAEVMRMTDNLKKVLGKGGFGAVYHGYLSDDKQVAVKLLSPSSSQGYKQFKAEVELLLRVHHKYLVSLIGYCYQGDHLGLIYEYMVNGDLKEHLSGKRGGYILNWADRVRIAAEAAQGLEYLHNGCKPPIIHRDVKTSNILLNEHFQVKLADFGLSRSFPPESQSHVSTIAAGTPGYVDPEYYKTNWLSEKSDIYSFGVVLLEIITNQSVIDNTRERAHITEWTNLMLSYGDITRIIDPRLQGDFETNTAWKILELAVNCVNHSPNRRPTMAYVMIELNECLATQNARMRGSREMDHSRDSADVAMSFVNEYAPGAR